MARQPEDVLPRFVDLAMEMTGGVSAGLSLYEENPAPGVFRWRYLRGTLSPFENATTPRNFSPCGITLDRNAPTLSTHPERFYNWISDANIVVPEVLLVPLYIGSVEPLGTLWIVSDKTGHFDNGHARIVMELAAFVGNALQMVRSEQRLQRALEEQETLAKEMSHRVKNMFAIAEGIVRASAKSSGSKEELANTISGRFHALAIAHGLVRRSFSDGAIETHGSSLRQLVETILKPHGDVGSAKATRIQVDGPALHLGDRAMNSFALALHELASNAAKYGALKNHDGTVTITWRETDGRVCVEWIETGGPCVDGAPTKLGFGNTLLHASIVQQLGGTIDHDWQPAGLRVTLNVPLANLAA